MATNTRQPNPDLQQDIERVASVILAGTNGAISINRLPLLPRMMMKMAMTNSELRTQLFRLVDVYPTLQNTQETLSHLGEYLANPHSSQTTVARALRLSRRLPFGALLTAKLTASNLSAVAKMFIAGVTPADIVDQVRSYAREAISTTTDVLGEKTLSQGEADAYEAKVAELIGVLASVGNAGVDESLLRDHLGPIPWVSVSVKPTALSPKYGSLKAELGAGEVLSRCKRLFEPVADGSLICYLDMEDHDVKDLTIDVIERISQDSRFARAHLGLVIQAYLRESPSDLKRVFEISEARVQRGWTPLWIRLVKGAYFDAEVVKSDQETWEPVVFTNKESTDYNYEHCVDLIFDNVALVRPAFGTHNLRSIAYIIAQAHRRGIDSRAFEIQMLYGMADALARGVKGIHDRVRLYLPMGELIPGMSYLVRRLLENTSNEGFLRQGFVESNARDVKVLCKAPRLIETSRALESESPQTYRHSPSQRFDSAIARERFEESLKAMSNVGQASEGQSSGREIPAVIDGQRVMTRESIDSVNPAHFSQIVARSARCGEVELSQAIDSCRSAQYGWSHTPATKRAEILRGAARYLRAHQRDVGALEVLEAGKNWKEADGDVTEAIDFLEFYAQEMLALSSREMLQSPLGERNTTTYVPKGIVGVIAPWNFPLAIPMGMVAGALVCGNTVILKPAEQTPATAYVIVEAFEAAGLPKGVLNFLPGVGEEIGRGIVGAPEISVIAFTGSYAVGTEIISRASEISLEQRNLKSVICELGGKNPIIVDADADLDQVIPGVMYSAFGFAGQKCSACSRLLVHERHADRVIERLRGALDNLSVKDPFFSDSDVGPVIDAQAKRRIESYLFDPQRSGEMIRYGGPVPEEGFYVAPTLIVDPDPQSKVVTDELFGPVLTVQRFSHLDEALAMANSTPYALTGGVYSRSPASIALVSSELNAGNLYINRHITGAVPGRQPFGGYQRSGYGSKAGGSNYLRHFLNERVVTENTLRQGFVPEIS